MEGGYIVVEILSYKYSNHNSGNYCILKQIQRIDAVEIIWEKRHFILNLGNADFDTIM